MKYILVGLEYSAELLVAEFLFLHSFQKRDGWKKRIFLLFPLCACFVCLPNYPLLNDSLGNILAYLLLFAGSVAYYFSIYQATIWSTMFCCIAGYITQHLAFNLHMCMLRATGRDFNIAMATEPQYWLFWCIAYICTYIVSYKLFGKKIKNGDCGDLNNRALISLLGVLLLITVVFNVLSDSTSPNLYAAILMKLYSSLCCILLLFVQFGLLSENKMSHELETVQHLLQQDRKQYEIAKENADLINMLCHDYRLQKNLYGKRGVVANQTAWEKAVGDYESIARIGNQALDVILTENVQRCKADHIQLTCMADGEKLNFVDEADLYALLSNAIDNAVSSVKKIEEVDKRFISLTIRGVGKCVSIHLENYYTGTLSLENGLPVSTKEDTSIHGYGMRSMQTIAERYNGSLTIELHDQIFALNILLIDPN